MDFEYITKENIKSINYNDVIIIFFTESSTIGEAGRVDIITRKSNNYKWYKTNYTYIGVTELIENLSDIVREEEKLFNLLPILKELNFNHTLIRESYLIDEEWYLFDLSFGNHLLIKDKSLKSKIEKKLSYYSSNDLYKMWEEIIISEL